MPGCLASNFYRGAITVNTSGFPQFIYQGKNNTYASLNYSYMVPSTGVKTYNEVITSNTTSTTSCAEGYPTIAINSTGYVFVAYQENSSTNSGFLKLSIRSTPNTWTDQKLDSSGDVGKYASIVLDSHDNMHIAYYDKTNGDLKYYYQAAPSGGVSAPIASFTCSPSATVRGAPVICTDTSTNAPTSWTWTGCGSNPCFTGTNNNQNPTIYPGVSGPCGISLLVSNAAGSSSLCSPQALYIMQPWMGG